MVSFPAGVKYFYFLRKYHTRFKNQNVFYFVDVRILFLEIKSHATETDH